MRPVNINFTMGTARDTEIVLNGSAVVADTPLVMVSDPDPYALAEPHFLQMASGGDLSTVNFVVTGIVEGEEITFTTAGPNNGTIILPYLFTELISVVPDDDSAETIMVEVGDGGLVVALDLGTHSWAVSLINHDIDESSDIVIEVTGSRVLSSRQELLDASWIPLATLSPDSIISVVDPNTGAPLPCVALRLTASSAFVVDVVQASNP